MLRTRKEAGALCSESAATLHHRSDDTTLIKFIKVTDTVLTVGVAWQYTLVVSGGNSARNESTKAVKKEAAS